MSSYRSEDTKYQSTRHQPLSPTDVFPSKKLCRSQENAKDSQEKKSVGKETNPALTPNLRLVKANYAKTTPRITNDCDTSDSSQVLITVTTPEKPRISCLTKRTQRPQTLKSPTISLVKNAFLMSPVVSLARIEETSPERSSKSGHIKKNSRECNMNVSFINDPMSPIVARSAGKTKAPRQRDMDLSNGDLSIESEMVVQTKLLSTRKDIKSKLQHSESCAIVKVVGSSRKLNYCDHESPKNTSSVCPNILEHRTNGKNTNAVTCTTRDDLDLLDKNPSLPCGNHLTLSPTVRLKRLNRVELLKGTTTNNMEESGEVNASDQSERRTGWSSSTSVKRKLLRNSERNVKRGKKGKDAKKCKKHFHLQCRLEIKSNHNPSVSPARSLEKKKCTYEPPSKCIESKNTFTSGLLAEWGMLPKSTRIQQKMLEEIEREPGDVGTISGSYSPYNRVFSLPCPFPSPSAGKTPTTKRRQGFAQTSPLVGKQVHVQ